MSLSRHSLLLGTLVGLACAACASEVRPIDTTSQGTQSPAAGNGTGGTGTGSGGTSPAPAPGVASGSFGGSYRVPVSPELTAAATYDVTEIHWVVTNDVATLSYNLPRALVGKTVRVDFTGPFDPATNRATLTGAAGTSECTIAPATISCAETMRGLLPLDPNLAVVEKLAAASYPGPAADRTAVAKQFAGDPIGSALIDLNRPGTPEPAEPAETVGHK